LHGVLNLKMALWSPSKFLPSKGFDS